MWNVFSKSKASHVQLLFGFGLFWHGTSAFDPPSKPEYVKYGQSYERSQWKAEHKIPYSECYITSYIGDSDNYFSDERSFILGLAGKTSIDSTSFYLSCTTGKHKDFPVFIPLRIDDHFFLGAGVEATLVNEGTLVLKNLNGHKVTDITGFYGGFQGGFGIALGKKFNYLRNSNGISARAFLTTWGYAQVSLGYVALSIQLLKPVIYTTGPTGTLRKYEEVSDIQDFEFVKIKK